MASNWNDLLGEARTLGGTHDIMRRRYLKELFELRGRNIIIYYSGWLQRPHLATEPGVSISIDDADKTGFMSAIKGMDRTKGLDLVLHTPGGDMAATESLVEYLRSMFGTNISAFIPQLAMSAGTMISCACQEIWMGKQSSLGPTDPQMGNLPVNGILEEFEQAAQEIAQDNARALVWQPILGKLHPSAINQCRNVQAWAQELTQRWLETGMFRDKDDASKAAGETVSLLTSSSQNRAHNRHLNVDTAIQYGLNIKRLEDDQALQDAVLTLHHACVFTLDATGAYKIIENHEGTAYIKVQRQIAIAT